MSRPAVGGWTAPTRRRAVLVQSGLTAGVLGGTAWILGARFDRLVDFLTSSWTQLLFWAALLLVVNLFPIRLGEMTLTLDMPFLLAIGILYPPEAAVATALVSGLDVREVAGRVDFGRALFNRGQIGLAVALGSAAFHLVSPDLESLPRAILGTCLALFLFDGFNRVAVAAFNTARTGTPLVGALRAMIVGPSAEFLGVYLGYGSLALILSFLFAEVGMWSVAAFLLPLLAARQALVREQRLQQLASRLGERERLLEQLLHRTTDERADERARIARDLHDDVLQRLIRISQLGGFLRQAESGSREHAEDLQELSELARTTADEVRRVVSGLRSRSLGSEGLARRIGGICEDLQVKSGIPIDFQVRELPPLAFEAELTAFHVAREALQNAVAHAGAQRICVAVGGKEYQVEVEVVDDGRGFDEREVDRTRHFGLGVMRERISLAGGTLEIVQLPSGGSRVAATIPAKQRPEAQLPRVFTESAGG